MIEKLDTNIEILDIDEENNYGKFALSPLERGYGTTIGNSIRRVLLSSLPGSSISKILIEGVLHEFSTIEGVQEDVPEIVLNIKGISLKKYSDEPITLFLDVTGPKIVTAKDIKFDANVEIANPDHYICTINEKGKLLIGMDIVDGKGYALSEDNKSDDDPIGTIAIDSTFTPVKRCNFSIENMRVGHRTDFDKLILEVWTNGTITPQEALAEGSKILIEDLELFKKLPDLKFPPEEEIKEEIVEEEEEDEIYSKTIEELDLSLRSFNCLKRGGFNTVGDIVSSSMEQLKSIKNFGRKSLIEVQEKIESLGLEIGQDE
ncbi:MAG: DNA-directed RNA polymerase subunit alpha [Peptoniphilaceae bacterium]|nr:DNA-directed RNA polymerase subunit alpha [Peptoniphilaceae bacterium]